MSIEVERVFKKLIKKIPQEQKNKEFYLLWYGQICYNKETYKGFKVFSIKSDRNEVVILSKDDFMKAIVKDIEEANVIN